MKLAYVGNFDVSFSTENHVAQGFLNNGWIVNRIQENTHTAEQIYAIAKNCDLLLYTRTWGVSGMMKVLEKLKEIRIPTASYHLDLYVGLKREDLYQRLPDGIKQLADDPFWRTEYVFTVDGDQESEKFFEKNGINHFYLQAGVHGQECYIHPTYDGTFDFDVTFVGSYGYHPEWTNRQELVDNLRGFCEKYGYKFGKFGNPQETIRGDDLNRLYARSRVVVGDSLCPMHNGRRHGFYWSDRIYETTGRGGFIIHPEIEGLQYHFDYGKDIETYKFGDFDGLYETIAHYIHDSNAREKIRVNGHQKTKRMHTYDQRVKAITNTIFS
jgi:hypothetical protein